MTNANTLKITLLPTGEIKIDKTKVFRYEKGEWGLPNSYIST